EQRNTISSNCVPRRYTAKLSSIEAKRRNMKRRKSRGKPIVSLETCYMCDKATVSREHAPPLGFFPEDRRVNLITVPSCKTHNNDNSDDVRYVRDIITSSIDVNEV